MSLFKHAIKQAIFNRPTYWITEGLVTICYGLNCRLSGNMVRYLYLSLVKLQLTIGFYAGLYSYGGDKLVYKRLRTLENQIIQIVSMLAMDAHAGDCEQKAHVLFATSFVHHMGGHTRLLQTYLSHIETAKLYVKGVYGSGIWSQQTSPAPSELFQNQSDQVVFRRQRYLSLKREIREVYRDLELLAPRCIVLFNHPIDLGLLVATMMFAKCRPKTRVVFYHHADDYFPFLGNVFDRHIDIDANQDAKCSDIKNRNIIRISVRDRMSGMLYPPMNGQIKKNFRVFSFVPMAKITTGRQKLVPFIMLVLRLIEGGIDVVLATPAGSVEHLSGLLRMAGCNMDCVTIDKDCTDISKYSGAVHAYLDTFPIGGGMSIIDGLSMGLPIMVYNAPNHQILRDSKLERFMFADSEAICRYVEKLVNDSDFYWEESALAYEIFKQFYSQEAMVNAMTGMLSELSQEIS